MKKLIILTVIILNSLHSSAQCVLPNVYTGNTGANMTVMLLPDFINSLELSEESAFIVAKTSSGLVIGSTSVFGVSQVSIAIWGDDSLTPEQDGAYNGDQVYFQLIDGTNLYDLYDESDLLWTVNYTTGGVQGLNNVVNAIINCSCLFNLQLTELLDSLTIVNEVLNESVGSLNSAIYLQEGWNIIGYGCGDPVNVIDALATYSEDVILLKDNNGAIYMPNFGFNGIGDFIPGFGYQVKLSETINNFNICE